MIKTGRKGYRRSKPLTPMLTVKVKTLQYGDNSGVSKRQAMNSFISGYMQSTKARSSFYRNSGINKIKFVHGQDIQYRRIHK